MYCIHTFTGSTDGCSTDANVYVNLFGELGDTGSRQLLRSNNHIKFREGQVTLAVFLLLHVSVSQSSLSLIADIDANKERNVCDLLLCLF